jgi:hypothetical protein
MNAPRRRLAAGFFLLPAAIACRDGASGAYVEKQMFKRLRIADRVAGEARM